MFNITPFLKFKAKLTKNLNFKDGVVAQERILLSLIRRAQATKFGSDHDFVKLQSILDYQRAVPLRTYDDFWTTYWKPAFPRLENCSWPGLVPFFAVSSGTTSGTSKYIPVTSEMVKSNARAGISIGVEHVRRYPNSRLLGGKCFLMGGSTALVAEAPGVLSGDLSGIAAVSKPWWMKSYYFPDDSVNYLTDWQDKIAKIAEQALVSDIRMISGVPSWLLIFFERLFSLKPAASGDLKVALPNLELFVHGGVKFDPYYNKFREILGPSVRFAEVYPASEGFIAIGNDEFNSGMSLLCDNEIFFEFVKVEDLGVDGPERYWLGNVELGVNYAIVLSTCAGLWSYILGDTVKFVSLDPPKLLVTGRTSYSLSAFGEHLIQEEIEKALCFAAQQCRVSVVDYVVAPLYPDEQNTLGGHIYIIEPDTNQSLLGLEKEFAKFIDAKLSELNDDYRAHRAGGFGLRDPEVKFVPRGFYAAWMKSRNKLGGQNKVPRIINDQTLLSSLLQFSGGGVGVPSKVSAWQKPLG